MNEIITRKADALVTIAWSGELVLTTVQLAEFYECSVSCLKMNFHRHRDRFTEGKHFFKINGGDIKRLHELVTNGYVTAGYVTNGYVTAGCPIPAHAPGLYLWTKSGAARHAKMLSTNRAWDVCETLGRHYFDRPVEVEEVASGGATTYQGTKCPPINHGYRHESLQNSSHAADTKIDRLLKCAELTADPQLRERLVNEAAKLILS